MLGCQYTWEKGGPSMCTRLWQMMYCRPNYASEPLLTTLHLLVVIRQMRDPGALWPINHASHPTMPVLEQRHRAADACATRVASQRSLVSGRDDERVKIFCRIFTDTLCECRKWHHKLIQKLPS